MIPKVIVGDHPDREWVVKAHNLEVSSGANKTIAPTEGAELLDLEHKEEVYERTQEAFLKLYEKEGYDVFRETIIQMKKKPASFTDEWALFKGESAEIILLVTILEFIKVHSLPWKVYHSLVIPHYKEDKRTTECDVVLVSEGIITVFEAKSYDGDKTLNSICTITRSNDEKDVYSQNALHCRSLSQIIGEHNLGVGVGMKSALFSFSEGNLTDNRKKEYKALMPVVDENSIIKYLSQLTKVRAKNWSPNIFTVMDELSTKHSREEHMQQFKK